MTANIRDPKENEDRASRPVTISIVQINARDDDKEGNIRKVLKGLEVAGERKSDIVVLPETFTGSGLALHNAQALAEPISGPTIKRLAELAEKHKMYIVGSLFEAGSDGKTYRVARTFQPITSRKKLPPATACALLIWILDASASRSARTSGFRNCFWTTRFRVPRWWFCPPLSLRVLTIGNFSTGRGLRTINTISHHREWSDIWPTAPLILLGAR